LGDVQRLLELAELLDLDALLAVSAAVGGDRLLVVAAAERDRTGRDQCCGTQPDQRTVSTSPASVTRD
jgi:hypothetical protein